jgi:hypothetical protein
MGTKCEQCGHEHDGWVPADRLSKVTEQRRAAEAARDEALGKVAELEEATGRLGELESQLSTLAAERDALTLRADIMSAGVTDPEGVAIVSTLWAALPDDARPSEGLSGWLTSPDAPRAVRVYLQQDEPPAAPPAAEPPPAVPPAAPPPGVRPPSTQGLRPTPPPAQGGPSAAQVAAMTPEQYRAQRDELLRLARQGG